MPAQQRVGGDESVVSVLLWEQPCQGCEDGPVWPGGARSGDVAAQHCDLVAQDEQLGVLGRLPASEQREPAKELAHDQVEELECHGWRSSPTSSAAAESHVNVMDEVSGTHTSRGHAWSTAALTPFGLRSGRPPTRPGEVVIDGYLAGRAGLRPGRRVGVLTTAGVRAYTVVGVAVPPGRDGLRREASLFFTEEQAARLAGGQGAGYHAVGVLAQPGVDRATLADRVAGVVRAPGIRVLRGAKIGEAEARDAVAGRDLALAITGSFGGISALLTGLVVAGPLTVAMLQRRRQIGLLRAVGATTGQTRRMIAGEIVLLTGVAVLVGGPLGLLLAGPLLALLAGGGVLPPGLVLLRGPVPVLVAAVLALLAAQAAGLVAVYRAGRIRPAEALREAAAPPRRLPILRASTGLLVATLGVGLALRPLATAAEVGIMETFAATAVLVAAVTLLGPPLAKLGAHVLGGSVSRIGGPSGRLAAAAARADPHRLAATVAPILLVFTLICVVGLSGATLQRAGVRQARARLTADFVLTAHNAEGLPPQVAERAGRLPGVATVAPTISTTLVAVQGGVPGAGQIGIDLPARGADPADLVGALDLAVRSGTLAALHGDAVAVSTSKARLLGWRVGDRVPVTFGDAAAATLPVVAVYARSAGFADLLLPRAVVARHVVNALDSEVLVSARPGSDLHALRLALDRLGTQDATLTVLDRAQALDRLRVVAALDIHARYLVVGVLIVFAAVAAVNMLLIGTARRVGELALLRLTGATRGQLLRMVGWEWATCVVLATTLGTCVAAVLLVGFSYGNTGSALPAIAPLPYAAGVTASALLALAASVVPATFALRARPLTAASAT